MSVRRYFAAFCPNDLEMIGELVEFTEKLDKEFGVGLPYKKCVPHITVIPPFSTQIPEKLSEEIIYSTTGLGGGTVTLQKVDQFNNNSAIFLKAHLDDELDRVCELTRSHMFSEFHALRTMNDVFSFSPHLTLVNKKIKEDVRLKILEKARVFFSEMKSTSFEVNELIVFVKDRGEGKWLEFESVTLG